MGETDLNAGGAWLSMVALHSINSQILYFISSFTSCHVFTHNRPAKRQVGTNHQMSLKRHRNVAVNMMMMMMMMRWWDGRMTAWQLSRLRNQCYCEILRHCQHHTDVHWWPDLRYCVRCYNLWNTNPHSYNIKQTWPVLGFSQVLSYRMSTDRYSP